MCCVATRDGETVISEVDGHGFSIATDRALDGQFTLIGILNRRQVVEIQQQGIGGIAGERVVAHGQLNIESEGFPLRGVGGVHRPLAPVAGRP